jgi:2-polyprenyl-6-hydroxyphenyl methylase / 3-demethylubiquinone-9 3-methyltransferase
MRRTLLKKLFSSSKTVDQKEINNFSHVSDWWESNGSMQALRAYNYLRVDYIKKILKSQNLLNSETRNPLKGLNILDVGCGGGLLAEAKI